MNWKAIGIGTGIGSLIVGGIIFLPKLIRLSKAAPNLDVIPFVKIHKLGLDGITIRLDVNMKNPTMVDFKMKFPYVKLAYNGIIIGSSQSVNKDIGLSALGEANISAIMVNIPVLSVLTGGMALLKALQSGEVINLDVISTTHIDPYWKYNNETKEWKRQPNAGKKSLINYSSTQTISLSK